MSRFWEWVKEHKAIALVFALIAAVIVYSSYKKQQAATSGSSSGGTLADGNIQQAGGYVFVPQNSGGTTSTSDTTAPDNTANTISALASFIAAVSPAGVAANQSSYAPTTDTTTAPTTSTASGDTNPNTAADLGALQGYQAGTTAQLQSLQPNVTTTNSNNKSSSKKSSKSTTVTGSKNVHIGSGTPATTKHTVGAANGSTNAKHPLNPNGVAARKAPVTHPVQGSTSQTGHLTTTTPTSTGTSSKTTVPRQRVSAPVSTQRPTVTRRRVG